MIKVLPRKWHIIVNSSNIEILHIWYESNAPSIGDLVGICYDNDSCKYEKSYNSGNSIKDIGQHGYDFGKRISFEDFKRLVLKENIEFNYEIY